MRQSLDQVNPRGRLDVAVFRIAERLALRHAPREWMVLRPVVERWARRTFGPRPRRRCR